MKLIINLNFPIIMKKLCILCGFVFLLLAGCKGNEENKEEKKEEIASGEMGYDSYGDNIVADNSLTASEMEERFKDLKPGDTVEVNFKTTVNSVCQNKGCWMKVDLPEAEDVMVKFKDYGFFVPKDVEKKEVVLNGKAYVTEVSIEEQRHYAEDGGKSPEEVASISEPKRELSFLADGVLIKQ